MPTTTPCARASSPPSSASCWNAVGSPLRPKRRWLVLALSKAGTTPSGCIPHWAIARPWPTKLPWRQSQPNRNHPSPQTLHEIGATSLFYEHQLPQPWSEDSELRLYQQALDQVELADRLGIDYVWEVEHHFLEEDSHSSAPEVFLAACSQRTTRNRLAHGTTLLPPQYTHPARGAERI